MSVLAVDPTKFPSGWSLKPLKAVADYFVSNVNKVPDETEEPVRLCNYTDVYKNEFIHTSMEFMRSTATHREIDKFRLVEGDVVITKDSETWEDIAVPALVVESADDLVCGYHLAMLRPFKDHLDGRFLFRCLQSKAIRLALELASTGITRFGLPKGEIGKLQLPIPPLPDQQRIAEYLDAETAEIDALIAEKGRMLTLLEEKRAALVTDAVTRGLDPSVPLKPSGIECFGNIPKHWRLMRLKHFAKVSYGVGDELDKSLTTGIPLISLPNVSKDGSLNLSEHGWADLDDKMKERMLLRRGDLLFNWRNGSSEHLGKTAYFDSEDEFTHVGFLLRVRFDQTSHCPRYFQFVLNTLRSTGFFLYSRAMVNNTFNQTELENLVLLIPPLEEQTAIATRLHRDLTLNDSIRSVIRNSVLLLHERRSTLITTAVTGQIPVEEMTG